MEGVLSKFVAFKLLIQIQDYYLRSRSNFIIKRALSEPLIIKTDINRLKEYTGDKKNKIIFNIMYYTFKVVRAAYTSIYFYFFPLFVCFVPAYKIAVMDSLLMENV